jgi:protein-tyrosine-phosphatase
MTRVSPRTVLFACNLNRVRSPMAAALLHRLRGSGVIVDSCGLTPADDIDPFVLAVMQEVGIDLTQHRPKLFDSVSDGGFDVVVTLTPEAQARAVALIDGDATALEYWPTEDPTLETGSREQRMAAYRRVRDTLDSRLRERFGEASTDAA